VFLGGVTTLEELVRRVFDRLLKESHTESWFEKIRGLFGDFIENVGLFGVSVAFSPPKGQLQALVRDFPTAVANVFEKIRPEKSGLVIVLDDINGLAEQSVFANWYKSFADSVATQERKFPVLWMLCGLPERRDSLSNLQPSLMRIFRPVEIEKLGDDEVAQFLRDAFRRCNMEVQPVAITRMVYFSSGWPTLMHEIGDATYRVDTDGVVDMLDAIGGISRAAENVGQKYLDPRVYRAIRSERYRAILRKLVSRPMRVTFSKGQIEGRLDESEKKVLQNFLKRMRELGVIEPDTERARGHYRFVNRIYPAYILVQSQPMRGR